MKTWCPWTNARAIALFVFLACDASLFAQKFCHQPSGVRQLRRALAHLARPGRGRPRQLPLPTMLEPRRDAISATGIVRSFLTLAPASRMRQRATNGAHP